MKYVLLIIFFIVGVVMFIDGIYRDEPSMMFLLLYITDVYLLMFMTLYCFITNDEEEENKKIEEELKDIKSPENSSL